MRKDDGLLSQPCGAREPISRAATEAPPSAAKHTPGPWVRGYIHGRCTKESHAPRQHPGPVGADPCDYTYKAELAADGDLIAADAMATILPRGTMETFLTEDDARLIGAAPCLLQALLMVREFVEAEVDNRDSAGGEMSDYVNEARDALDTIDAAIAKATGA